MAMDIVVTDLDDTLVMSGDRVNEAMKQKLIEKDARVGQMYFHECDAVAEENLYQGQFQNDKQR